MKGLFKVILYWIRLLYSFIDTQIEKFLKDRGDLRSPEARKAFLKRKKEKPFRTFLEDLLLLLILLFKSLKFLLFSLLRCILEVKIIYFMLERLERTIRSMVYVVRRAAEIIHAFCKYIVQPTLIGLVLNLLKLMASIALFYLAIFEKIVAAILLLIIKIIDAVIDVDALVEAIQLFIKKVIDFIKRFFK